MRHDRRIHDFERLQIELGSKLAEAFRADLVECSEIAVERDDLPDTLPFRNSTGSRAVSYRILGAGEGAALSSILIRITVGDPGAPVRERFFGAESTTRRSHDRSPSHSSLLAAGAFR